MVVRIGTHMMLIVMVILSSDCIYDEDSYKVDETLYQRQMKPDKHVEIYFIF